MAEIEGTNGLLAEQVRHRYQDKVLTNLLVEYAVLQPGQEGLPEPAYGDRTHSTPPRKKGDGLFGPEVHR